MGTFYTGNTGRSTGPHLDMRVFNPATGQYENPSGYTRYLTQDGKPFSYPVTSGYGMRDHPVTGGRKMHHGIDYATPTGTALTIDGHHMSTWNDAGGGVMSQYLISTDDGDRELLLLHGSDQNKITGKGAITSYKPEDFRGFTPPELAQKPEGVDTTDTPEPVAPVVADLDIDTSTDTDTGTDIKANITSPTRPAAKERAQVFKAFTAGDVVKGLGNDFDKMKSQELANHLRQRQVDIIQKRMDAGTNFGGKMVDVDK